MTPISMQNALQNHYLSAEDRYISEAEGPRDETTIQNTDQVLHHLEDRTTVQSIDLAIDHLEDRTTVQYADSAIYRPADQTTIQLLAPITNCYDNQTMYQKDTPHAQQEAVLLAEPETKIQGQTVQHNVLQAKEFFSTRLTQLSRQFLYSIRRIAEFKQRVFNPTRQSAVGTSKALPSPYQDNRLPLDRIAAEAQPSPEEYQKVLRELDHCRLCFAKELARNGKLRNAIALANKISETSHFFRDAQTLTRSWKQL